MNKLQIQILFITMSIFVLLFVSNAIGQNMEIYVSDAGNWSNPPWKILKFDENGQNPQVFIDDSLAWPQDILFIEDQNVVLISNLNSGRVTKHDATTGAYISDFATSISGPTRMKIGTDSLLYVLQWSGNGRVLRFNLDGTALGEFTSVGVSQSIGLDWDSHNNLYVSSWGGAFVRKFSPTGADLGLFIGSNLTGPTNIWFDAAGDLLVINYSATTIKRFDSTGTYIGNFITGLSQAEGVDFLPNGNILIGNGASSSVKMFDSSGTYISDFIPSGSGGLLRPNAVVIRNTNVSAVPEKKEVLLNSKNLILHQNYPNPFNPVTKIKFYLPKASLVNIEIFNMLGKKIKTVLNQSMAAGYNDVTINANDLAGGIYFYRIKAGNFQNIKKMILLK